MPTIDGTASADNLSDTTAEDIINGLDGDDTITFDDQNSSSTTTDTANGGGGTDTLVITQLGTGLTRITDPAPSPGGGFQGTIRNFSNVWIDYTSIERFIITTDGGQDFLVLASGDDEASLGSGDDFIDMGSGTNIADGGSGIDRISADLSADTLGIVWNLATNSYSGPGSYTNFEVFDTITTGSGNDTLTGGTQGPSMPATINLGAGDDSAEIRSAGAYDVDGGSGSDRLIVDYGATSAGVSSFATPNGGGGFNGTVTDGSGRVVDFIAIEHFSITTGSGADQLTLYSGDDFASLGAGSDTVDFGAGNNSGDGGDGTDRISVDMAAATTAISWNLQTNSYSGPVGTSFTNFEHFGDVRTGSGSDTIVTGTLSLSDTLRTGAGADTVTVAAGYDFVFAGAGLDTLIVNYSGATTAITTNLGPFADANGFSGRYNPFGSLGVEYSGIDRFIITTGSGNDSITTATGNDIVSTGAGNDFVDVGSGSDQADGGAGIDSIRADMSAATTAIIWNIQTNTYSGPVGTSFTNFESFFELFTGSGDDVIVTSFSAAPEEIVTLGGNDTITVGGGFDVVFDNAGFDTLIVDYSSNTAGVTTTDAPAFNAGLQGFGGEYSASGTGSVSYDGIDRFLITTGSGNDDIVTADGNDSISTGAGNDTLNGGAGDDQLDGGAGADAMTGGLGNDTFIVDDPGDTTVEAADGGTDLVLSSITLNLSANVENLTLTGIAAINGTGNSLANIIIGNAAANVLNGRGGADTMRGGDGNDIYVVDNSGDKAIETSADGGTDEVRSTVSFTLGANVENLTLLALLFSVPAINGTGNELANILTGNSAANILDGKAGADVMRGGAGDDTYIVDDAGDQAVEELDAGLDIVRSSVSFTLGAHVENLVLTGVSAIDGTGNGLANAITGNAAANILSGGDGNDNLNGGDGDDQLFGGAGNDKMKGGNGNDRMDGGAGNDQMEGGDGDDFYLVDNSSDNAIEFGGGGIDSVESSVSFQLGPNVENLTLTGTGNINGIGNAEANTIIGTSGNNVLNGGTGADMLIGGLGNDLYVVDNAGDVVTESSGAGSDTVNSNVSYTLPDNVERLKLLSTAPINATGNALANELIGNNGANILDGGAGADRMNGGLGNDTYIVDNASDKVVETSNIGGSDTVFASVSFQLDPNIETLILTGGGDINGTGNAIANTLAGNAGANILNGGAGADTMEGGDGNDTYIVDNGGDQVIEASAAGGIDEARSSVSYTLGDNVENLRLIGSAAIDGTGNALANTITGNAANNLLRGEGGADLLQGSAGDDALRGGLGNDTLHGGGGADQFVFDTAPGAGNIDAVLDFLRGVDRLVLDNAVFASLPDGALAANALVIGTAATSADHRIIYDPTTGNLSYDSDGVGGAAAVQFATLANQPASLSASDFAVI